MLGTGHTVRRKPDELPGLMELMVSGERRSSNNQRSRWKFTAVLGPHGRDPHTAGACRVLVVGEGRAGVPEMGVT